MDTEPDLSGKPLGHPGKLCLHHHSQNGFSERWANLLGSKMFRCLNIWSDFLAQIRIIESLFVGLDNEKGGPKKWGGGISDTSDNSEKCWLWRQWILDWDQPFDHWCVYWKIRWFIVRNHHDHSGVEKKTGRGNETDAFERVDGSPANDCTLFTCLSHEKLSRDIYGMYNVENKNLC
ncbi:hypothetical protein TNIN_75431 [Trichonephila inaurata madagascariensis]|uniref:Uncharacterized protein n=1 Tax=Trichonephila inaurata madagascariensis TaxID=2747483 RepID=A0A8X7BUB1_9ARAC|nr:hypothetical protein TNIN_75431 [Trichonephila inaurata madagascariensis]